MRSVQFLVTALVLLSTGCSPSQPDYDFLVGHSLTGLDRHEDIRAVVLAPELSEQVMAAAAKHYKVIDQSAVVPVEGYDLAPGLAVLQAVTIKGNEARVMVQTGPIRSGVTLSCGGDHTFSYSKSSSGWIPGRSESVVC